MSITRTVKVSVDAKYARSILNMTGETRLSTEEIYSMSEDELLVKALSLLEDYGIYCEVIQ